MILKAGKAFFNSRPSVALRRSRGWELIKEVAVSTAQSLVLLMLCVILSALRFIPLDLGDLGHLFHSVHVWEAAGFYFLWPSWRLAAYLYSMKLRAKEDRNRGDAAFWFDVGGLSMSIAPENMSYGGACIYLPSVPLSEGQILRLTQGNELSQWSDAVVCWIDKKKKKRER